VLENLQVRGRAQLAHAAARESRSFDELRKAVGETFQR
jgi:hypothetical protein